MTTVGARFEEHLEIPVTEARDQLAEVVNRVRYQHERVVLTRHGKGLVALVPLADLELLERIEDWADLRDARAARAHPDNQGDAGDVDWEAFKAQLS
jgi:prevent-host-death family protein